MKVFLLHLLLVAVVSALNQYGEDGQYVPDNSGQYIPDNSGQYIHDDSGRYIDDGTGRYRDNIEKYRHVGDGYNAESESRSSRNFVRAVSPIPVASNVVKVRSPQQSVLSGYPLDEFEGKSSYSGKGVHWIYVENNGNDGQLSVNGPFAVKYDVFYRNGGFGN